MTPAYSDLLDSAAGLALSHQSGYVEGPMRFQALSVDVGLRFDESRPEAEIDEAAGAVGFTRSDALMRGVGEAVERRAVMPLRGRAGSSDSSRVVATRAELQVDGVRTVSGGGWGCPVPPDDEGAHGWYRSRALSDGELVMVPEWWVDVPCAQIAPGWQGCPSGVAAHLTEEAAVASALNEVAERDAVMRAWADPRMGVAEVDTNDVIGLLADSSNRDWRLAGKRLAKLAPAGIAPAVRVFRLSSGALPTIVYLAWVSDGEVAVAGAGAGASEPDSLVKAVREAWQANGVLRCLPADADGTDAGRDGYVERSRRRIRHWASADGVKAFEEWTAAIPAEARFSAQNMTRQWAGRELASESLPSDRLVLVVDLTHRLPDAVREFGFKAVKVLVEGAQPLVVAEGEPWAYLDASLIPRRPNGLIQPLV